MTADQQAPSVTPINIPALTVSKPWGAVRAAMTQGAWTSAARGLLVPVPRLMQGVEQWLPEDSIISTRQSLSSGPSPRAAVGSRHSIAGPAGMAADGKAVYKMPGSSLTSSIGPSPSAAVGSRHSIAGPAGMAAEGKAVLKMPGSTLTSSSHPSKDDSEQTAGAAASPLLPLVPSSSHPLERTAGHSPAAKLQPRRGDSAFEQTGVTGWTALSQHKAAAAAAAVNKEASEVVEQTSDMLQRWSDSQLSAKTNSAENQMACDTQKRRHSISLRSYA